MLNNMLNCGKLEDCHSTKDKDRNTLFGLAFLAANNSAPGGINVTPVDLSGASDDPTVYATPHTIQQALWDETKVRKILLTFAYGGPASDAQITEWAAMKPSEAIVEMLTMKVENPYLAQPIVGKKADVGSVSLSNLSNQFAGGSYITTSNNNASNFNMTSRWSDSPGYTWYNAVRLRAMNPFRLKVGFWETNYHLSINLDKNVAPVQMFYFFDTVVNDISAGKNYEEVLANAATSAPVATQYNHKKNTFVNNAFRGNEDFAREYHQLFFGILGTGLTQECSDLSPTATCTSNPENYYSHENLTIRQTAEALTGINVGTVGDRDSETANISSSGHKTGDLSIYGQKIGGTNASERFASIRKISIQHPESLQNLPVKIIKGFADENLDPSNPILGTAADINAKLTTIRSLWKEMSNKNIVEFLRKYAISTAYHNTTRVKYRSSVDRAMTILNLITLGNDELIYSSLQYNNPLEGIKSNESVTPFRPEHDVFGSQTGLEASETDSVFINQYNNSSNGVFGKVSDNGTTATNYTEYKNYKSLLPDSIKTDQGYPVEKVAEFLWKRFYGKTSSLGTLEKIHIYSFLASGIDFSFNTDKACRESIWNCKNTAIETYIPISGDVTASTSQHYDLYRNYKDAVLFKSTNKESESREENIRIGYAIDFIVSTPFIFVEEGE